MKIEEALLQACHEVFEPAFGSVGNLPRLLHLLGLREDDDPIDEVSDVVEAALGLVRFLSERPWPNEWNEYLEFLAEISTAVSRVRRAAGAENVARAFVRVFSTLLSYWIRARRPAVWCVLDILRIVRPSARVQQDRLLPPAIYELDLDALWRLINDPISYVSGMLGIGLSPAARAETLASDFVPRAVTLLRAFGARAAYDRGTATATVAIGFGQVNASLSMQVTTSGELQLRADDGVSLRARLKAWEWRSTFGPRGGEIRVIRSGETSDADLATLGVGNTGLRVGAVETYIGFAPEPPGRWSIGGVIRRLTFELSGGMGDSFLSSATAGSRLGLSGDLEFVVRSDGTFSCGWDGNVGGLRRGAAATIGPITIRAVQIDVRPVSDGITLQVTLDFGLSLGPLDVQVEKIGLRASILAPRGDLGQLDFGLRFAPPFGLGVSISAGPVRGGGFIAYDDALGRYSGALSLSIGDIALRAIGILDTRAPGVSGYSFLIVISAEFTPIQLGFGFTLTGVGGLCGIQRAVSVPALQEGVRSGTLASLLFSRDPIGQATQLIAGLQRAFPPTQDRYVFGPMFKLGWGTPTLLTADLGIVLQLPSPIVIALLGTLSAKLPRPEGAVVEINLDILGVLDLGEKKLSIDASLRDSRIAAFTLTGDLALRYHWGAEPDFALSLGGFNPDFKPPPGFPTLRRLSLALGNGNNPRLSLSAYFALTSNTLQFGARAEVYAEALGFNLLGYLEFHALFVFSPFSFRFDFSAGVALRRGTSVLMAVSVVGRIEGPRPWRVQGRASVSILFFEVTVSFDETFGDPPDPARLPPVDVWVPLRAAFGDLRNWSATLPEGAVRCVSTAAAGNDPGRVRLDPQSVLAVRQKVMPLDRRITKLGEQPVAAPTRVRVTAVRVGCNEDGTGGTAVAHEALSEPFAAGQYEALDDAQRLSRPSFEPMVAGAKAQGRALKTERAVTRRPQVETIRVGRSGRTAAAVLQRMQQQAAQVDSASVAGMRTEGMARYAPGVDAVPMVTLAPERWVVASSADLRKAPSATPGPWGAVAEGGRGAGERGAWQVVPEHEVRR